MALKLVNFWDPFARDNVPIYVQDDRLLVGSGDQGTTKKIYFWKKNIATPLLIVGGKMQITDSHITKDLWLACDLHIDLDGNDNVVDWGSNEGDGYNCSFDSGHRPPYRAAYWNDISALEFQSGNDDGGIFDGGSFGAATDAFTFVGYIDPDNTGVIMSRWHTTNDRRSYRIGADETILSSNGSNSGSSISWTKIDGPQILTVRYDGGNTYLEGRVNKVLKDSINDAYSSLYQPSLNIRIGHHSGYSGLYDGHLGDIYFFKRYLPDGELEIIEDKIQSKFTEAPTPTTYSDGHIPYHNPVTKENGEIEIDDSQIFGSESGDVEAQMPFWNYVTKEWVYIDVKSGAIQITTGSAGEQKQIVFWDPVERQNVFLNVFANKLAVSF